MMKVGFIPENDNNRCHRGTIVTVKDDEIVQQIEIDSFETWEDITDMIYCLLIDELSEEQKEDLNCNEIEIYPFEEDNHEHTNLLSNSLLLE